MKAAILQSNYIPWKGYFDLMNSADVFIIYDEVQYTKNDWRNRNRIKTANGIIWLTIPVRQNNLAQRIIDTEVVNNGWRKKHWNSIAMSYSKTPFFKKYNSQFEEIYLRTGQLPGNLLQPVPKYILRLQLFDKDPPAFLFFLQPVSDHGSIPVLFLCQVYHLWPKKTGN